MDASLTGFIGIEASPPHASTVGTSIRTSLGADCAAAQSTGSKTGSLAVLTLLGEGAGSAILADKTSSFGKGGISQLTGDKKR